LSYIIPKSIGINSQRLAKYLELFLTVKLPPFWSMCFEPYERIWAKCLCHIGGFNVPYIMPKSIGINPERLAKYLGLFLTVKLPPFWSRCIGPYERVWANCLSHICGFNVPYIMPKSIGISYQRLAKYLELFLTVKLPPFWSRCFEQYERVWATCLSHIYGFIVPYIMPKSIGINSQRLAKSLELFLIVKLPPFWSRCFGPYERVWENCLSNICRFSVPYIMPKSIGISSQRLAKYLNYS